MEFKTGYAFIDMNEYNEKMKELKGKRIEIEEALKDFKMVYINDGSYESSFTTEDEIIKKRRDKIDKEKEVLKGQMKEALLEVRKSMSKKQWEVFMGKVRIKWEPESMGWIDYL